MPNHPIRRNTVPETSNFERKTGKLAGVTARKETHLGSVYTTINTDVHGNPVELMVTSGRAGSDVYALAESLGRVTSLYLQTESSVPRNHRLESVRQQLEHIGGSDSLGMGKNKITSLPDAVAHAIADFQRGFSLDEPSIQGHASTEPKIIADICPNCGEATFVREEGCRHCLSCGHSQC